MKIFNYCLVALFFTGCTAPKTVTEKYEITYMDGVKDTITITHSADTHVRTKMYGGMKYLVIWDRPGRVLINGVTRDEIPGVAYFKLIK